MAGRRHSPQHVGWRTVSDDEEEEAKEWGEEEEEEGKECTPAKALRFFFFFFFFFFAFLERAVAHGLQYLLTHTYIHTHTGIIEVDL